MIFYSGLDFIPKSPGPYVARSASDLTDDWPAWYVAGPDGRRNVMTLPDGHPYGGCVLTSKEVAEALASKWNACASGEER